MDIVGLAAVILVFAIPLTGIATYGYYRVSKLRTEERLAALARGVSVPMEPELSQVARSRRAGILLVAGALGFITTFALELDGEPKQDHEGKRAVKPREPAYKSV